MREIINSTNNPYYKEITDAIKLLNQSLIQLEYEQAIKYAHQGEWAIAEYKLKAIVEQTNPEPHHLDLMARIYAQQGKFDLARKAWEQALYLDPQCSSAKEALEYLSDYKRGMRYNRVTLINLAFIIVILVMGILFWKTFELNNSVKRTLHEIRISNSIRALEDNEYSDAVNEGAILQIEKLATKDDVVILANQIERLKEQILVTPTSSKGEILTMINLQIPGVKLLQAKDRLEISFERGIFLYEHILNDEGKEALKEIGYKLEPYAGQIQLEIYGFTDDTEKSLQYLEIQRALAVMKYLTSTTQLPADIFSLRSSNGMPAPYPNNSLQNRMKNRTALLIIRINP